MKIPARARESGPRFTITPLVDICFNLFVFFGLASLYVKKETADLVALPEAREAANDHSAASRHLVITINAKRHVSVEGNPVQRSDLERIIADRCGPNPSDFHLRVRSDKSVPYRDVKPLILASARRGVTNLEFAVQHK